MKGTQEVLCHYGYCLHTLSNKEFCLKMTIRDLEKNILVYAI